MSREHGLHLQRRGRVVDDATENRHGLFALQEDVHLEVVEVPVDVGVAVARELEWAVREVHQQGRSLAGARAGALGSDPAVAVGGHATRHLRLQHHRRTDLE
jgi:hypothetical protein